MCGVGHLEATVLLATPVVEVALVACCAPRSPAGELERNDAAQIVLPRRGTFALHRDGEDLLADPTCAVVFAADESYRASHPLDGGDECLTRRGRRRPGQTRDDLGFAHHSHFTARFRSIFGRTPRRARDAMISGRIRDLSTIMTADLDASP
jgi:uncharacterized C2H2 Zn-finger protein